MRPSQISILQVLFTVILEAQGNMRGFRGEGLLFFCFFLDFCIIRLIFIASPFKHKGKDLGHRYRHRKHRGSKVGLMRHDGSSRSQQGRLGISSIFEGGVRSLRHNRAQQSQRQTFQQQQRQRKRRVSRACDCSCASIRPSSAPSVPSGSLGVNCCSCQHTRRVTEHTRAANRTTRAHPCTHSNTHHSLQNEQVEQYTPTRLHMH